MITLILTVLMVIVTDAFGYWVHRALHQTWMGPLHRAHLTHHLVLYPSTDFTSDTYRDSGKDDTTWTFLLVGFPLLGFPLLLAFFGVVGWVSAIWLVGVTGGIGLLHSFIHDWIHLRSHWFHWIPGSKKLIELHRVHHTDLTKNFGIFTFFWDKLSKTYEDVR